jgi:uncharacterized Zn-binding protein involved in type VI secretion
MAGKPAARVGDQTAHGGVITGPGVATVLIGGQPAAVMGDQHSCPMVNPTPAANPHVGGPIIATGATVLIGGKPSARLGDTAICQGPPSTIILGCTTVLIGDGGGGGGGGAASGKKAKAEVKTKESEAEEKHYLDVKFVDKAGKPITGVQYTVKTPEGNISRGPLTGKIKKSGIKEGNCEIALRAITKAEWSKAQAKAREKVKMKAETAGIEDGIKTVFHIHIRDANYADRELTSVESSISGNKAEAEWELSVDDDLLNIQADKEQIGRFSAPVFYFTVEAGGMTARSPFLNIVDEMEVRVVDEEGKPLKNKKYRLILPDGRVREGTLDGDGIAKLTDIPPGRVQLAVDVRE